ncbi:MAG TPA: hypothetical protein VFI13_10590 [Gemmatimonadales bacterium]|nr:hypothetical protein [Gemmatimonadales bacterium]
MTKPRKTPLPAPAPIVRGPLALTTYVDALTEAEREILRRQAPHPGHRRGGRPSDPETPRPRTEAA